MSIELEKLRLEIDILDQQLLAILAKRVEQTKIIGAYKRLHGLAALDDTRWQQASRVRLQQAQALGLDQEMVTKLYDLIHDYTLQLEKEAGAQ
jgi:chorismate mutase